MSALPLTLSISLCLVFSLVVFFLREQARRSFSRVERDALRPPAGDTPRSGCGDERNYRAAPFGD